MIYDSAQDKAFDYQKQFNKEQISFKLGTIAPWVQEDMKPVVIFWGEEHGSYKAYKCLSTYKPKYNDDILLAKVGATYVVLGKLEDMVF